MTVDQILPQGPIAAALIAVLGIPLYFLALSRGPTRLTSLGHRYKAGMAMLLGTWLVLSIAFGTDRDTLWPDLAAGAMIVATAIMASFNSWALLCWGFMLSMLMAIFRADRPLSLDQWIDAQSGGTIDAFSQNRVKVLLGMGLAEQLEDRIAVTSRRGRIMARLACFTASWYRIP